jgi:predicted RNase H-like HicB family nuclease
MEKETVHTVVFKSGDSENWVAICLEYDVVTEGDTEAHAIEMIREAVELHLENWTKDDFEVLHQTVDGEPKVYEVSISAPALLNT